MYYSFETIALSPKTKSEEIKLEIFLVNSGSRLFFASIIIERCNREVVGCELSVDFGYTLLP